ncbi:MAG: methyltransferase domain-containing protein [Rhodospirillales bacterium]|nr:methyltransferase domain-containing protein [Rhodospirillales bacterium]
MSRGGTLPACASCGSLERHRTVRAVWSLLVGAELRRLKAIQFSLDPSVDKDWFDSLEVSVYERRNSLDLENIYRLSGSYDIVICNHVLEHIEDDRRAFREIMRVLTPWGLFQFTVPLPRTRAVTEEWGYPDRPHGHFRVYGRDLIDRFAETSPGTRFLCVPCADPVTGEADFVYLAFLDERRLNGIRQVLGKAFPSLTVNGHEGSCASAGVRHFANR